ncbi:MAG: hypothetical protein D6702_08160 [Planctomycetota bacterium]|nr:MAG: hypothetical protein D6702_08160 [Planctomycetota bacterium]
MNPAQRHQLARIDRALLALLDERARLLARVPAADPGRRAALDDLLRRHDGPFDPSCLAEFFAAVDRGCRPAAEEENR